MKNVATCLKVASAITFTDRVGFLLPSGGSDSSSDVPADSDFVAPIGVAGEIAKVVCEPLSSLWQKSGSENKESWQCKRDDTQVDFWWV